MASRGTKGHAAPQATAKARSLPAQAIRISAKKSRLFNSSLAKGLAILSAFDSQNPTHSFLGLAAATGLTTSAAQRLSYTLETLGYLRRDPVSKRLALTPAIVELGLRYVRTDRLLKLSHAYLHAKTSLRWSSKRRGRYRELNADRQVWGGVPWCCRPPSRRMSLLMEGDNR